VSGAGIDKLRNNGCEVLVGVLEQDCIDINKRFFTYHNKKRPYIILKWAETNDGFIDKLRDANDDRKPNWITGVGSRQLVHQWRAEEEAILVGTNTVINDNPKLDVREWYGENPIRVIIDSSLRVSKEYHIYNDVVNTIILTAREVSSKENVIFEQVDFSKNVIEQICMVLYKHNIQSVFVEGGRKTLQTFIDSGVWDETRFFIGNVSFAKGISAPKVKGELVSEARVENDVLKVIKNVEVV